MPAVRSIRVSFGQCHAKSGGRIGRISATDAKYLQAVLSYSYSRDLKDEQVILILEPQHDRTRVDKAVNEMLDA